MLTINVLVKPSSGMCNMHCDYCSYCDEAQKRLQKSYGLMSEETLKSVICKTILRIEGAAAYAFQGGEPTLRGIDSSKRVIVYETQYNRYRMQVRNALQTNGYLLDDERCRSLKENHFLVGLSLNGTKGTSDMYRHASGCESVSDRIFQVVKLLERHGADFSIPTTVTNNTAAHIKGIYELHRKQDWDYQQHIACLDPSDEEHGENSYALFPEQYKDFLITLFYPWYEDWKKGCQPYVRQFENYIGILMSYRPEACDQYGVCSIQSAVEADGSVYSCGSHVLSEYRLGNSNMDQLDSTDRRRQEIGFIERSKKLKDSCLSCSHYNICRGGCQRNRDLDPESGLYDNHFCESYRIFFDTCLPLMEEIAKKQSTER